MDGAGLIASLVALEGAASKTGDLVTRDFIIAAQDWVLQTQKENLELRREIHFLRQRYESPRIEQGQAVSAQAVTPLLQASSLRKSRRVVYGSDAVNMSQAPVELAPAV